MFIYNEDIFKSMVERRLEDVTKGIMMKRPTFESCRKRFDKKMPARDRKKWAKIVSNRKQ